MANQTSIIGSCAAAFEQLSDTNLVCLAREGDSQAFAFLLERNRTRLFRKIHRILRHAEDAQDALQECFLKAWLYLDRFEGKAKFSTWLTRIAINEALMLIRRKRPMESYTDSDFDIPDSRLSPQQHYLRSEASAFVWHEVARLPQGLQTIFTMRYAQELSTNEVACMLAVSEAAVKSRLHRIRLHLRKQRLNREMNSKNWSGNQYGRRLI